MPSHIKAFIVLMFLSIIVFAFAKESACIVDDCSEFRRRRNLWFALTASAFLSYNFWIYVGLTTIFITYTLRKETHKATLFLFLLFIIPPVSKVIPGFGGLNALFALNHIRLLSLLILFPVFLSMVGNKSNEKAKKSIVDIIVVAIIILGFILDFRYKTATDSIRSAFYGFTDTYIPYYVISRSFRTVSDFHRTFLYFTIAVGILSAVAIIEHLASWLLYQSLLNVLDLHSGLFKYSIRANSIRATASTGHSIVLGYLITIAIGFVLFLKSRLHSKSIYLLLLFVLLAGSFSTVSRGPWMGVLVLLIVFLLTGPYAIRKFLKWILLMSLFIPIIMTTQWGQHFIDLLPYVGTVESENIDYREILFDKAVTVIAHHPLFGSVNFLETPEMQELLRIQGGGIIDITNSYLGIALQGGLVTLGLFLGCFLFIIFGIYRSMRSLPKDNAEIHLIGRVLIATILSMLFILITVSQISVISIVTWSVAAMGVGYIRMVAELTRANKEKDFLSSRSKISAQYF
jgi:O-antigen ligase